MNKTSTLPWLLVAYVSCALLWGSCSSKTPIPTDDPLILAFTVTGPTTGTALNGATALQGQASSVDVFLRSNPSDPKTEQIIRASSMPVPFSLPLSNLNQPVRAAVLDIPAGFVMQVRIQVDSLTAVFPDHVSQVALPGHALRIVPNGTFQVTAGAESDLLIPINPQGSITSSCQSLTMASPTLQGMIAQPLDVDPNVITGSMNVYFASGTSFAAISNAVTGFDARASILSHTLSNLVRVAIPSDRLLSAATSYFAGLSQVSMVSPNRLLFLQSQPALTTPSNDSVAYPPYFHQAVYEAHTITVGDSVPVIAILDSGADLANPDLAMNVWINQGELPKQMQTGGTAGAGADFDGDGVITFRDLNMPGHDSFLAQFNITKNSSDSRNNPNFIDAYDLMIALSDKTDNDGNGYVDDLVGVNVVTGGSDPSPAPPPNGEDEQAHGRYTAAAAAATENNALGIPGVAPFARIMFVTTCSTVISGCALNYVEQAMDYAAMEKADVVNRSEGALYYKSDGLNLAFGNASDAGTVLSGSSEANCVLPPGAPSGAGAQQETPANYQNILNQYTALDQRAAYGSMLVAQATGNCSAFLSNANRAKVFFSGVGNPNAPNVITVTSFGLAGNSGPGLHTIFLPDHTGQEYQFGNMGSDVTDIAAMGGNEFTNIIVLGGLATETLVSTGNRIPYQAAAAGTSLAAPMVVGAAALVLSAQPSLRGHPDMIRTLLMATADKNAIADRPSIDDQPGYPGPTMVNSGNRLNVCSAVAGGTCPVPYYSPLKPDAGTIPDAASPTDASCDAIQECEAGVFSPETCSCVFAINLN